MTTIAAGIMAVADTMLTTAIDSLSGRDRHFRNSRSGCVVNF